MRVTSDEFFTDLVDDIDGGEVLLVFMDLENGEDVQASSMRFPRLVRSVCALS